MLRSEREEVFAATRGTRNLQEFLCHRRRQLDFCNLRPEMVGSLDLPNVIDGDPLDMSCTRTDRGLDSPDSGLPPSPSPSAWLQPVGAEKAGGVNLVSEEEGRASLVCNIFCALQYT